MGINLLNIAATNYHWLHTLRNLNPPFHADQPDWSMLRSLGNPTFSRLSSYLSRTSDDDFLVAPPDVVEAQLRQDRNRVLCSTVVSWSAYS
ncbi:hypothetical protein P3L10_026392 [Capsicum annuum]